MEEIAYAKLNLALHVRGREPDGYHRIETYFAFCETGDCLSVEDDGEIGLEVTGPFAGDLGAGSDNLVLRAAYALREQFGVTAGARLTLEKNLPVASGIGGGSADAAAALRLLARWWKLPTCPPTTDHSREWTDPITGIAANLGADVPACLVSRTARGEGRGDRLQIVDCGLAHCPVLLVNPGVAVSTAAVFRGWDGVDRGPMPVEILEGRNDLEPAARKLAPEIGTVLAVLEAQQGVRLRRMSGSGATCFALFGSEEERDRAAAAIAVAHPGWWRLSTRLI